MRTIPWAAALAALSLCCSAADNITRPTFVKQILPASFTPPQHFKHNNLVRNINLEKGYPRETINLVVQNVDKTPQSVYYIPFETDVIASVGGLEVRDKKDALKPPFKVEAVGYDVASPTEYFRVTLSEPLPPKSELTLSISYHMMSSLTPLPATVDQSGKQYLQYSFSAHCPVSYPTTKQKTKLKFPSGDVPDYTSLKKNSDPTRQGSTFTYGPYSDIKLGSLEPVSVRYEFTKPVLHASLLERDVEVSHWGGNLATEERIWLTNRGAKLKQQFSRLQWQVSSMTQPVSTALKELRMPIAAASSDPYFVDDIGNVSTSHFRQNQKEALLELRPRYPVFGGWFYNYKVGWDASLATALRSTADGHYVLKVPFLEGPKMSEGIEYAKVVTRIILPEGASNVQFTTPIPLTSSLTLPHRTFMDTLGRTTLVLTAHRLSDEWRDETRGDVLVTYEYSTAAALRKPLAITLSLLGVFVLAWAVGSADTSISAKKRA